MKLERQYNLDAPKGVNGRNSDNTMIARMLGWEPHLPAHRTREDLRLDLRSERRFSRNALEVGLAPRRLNPRLRAGRRTRATPLPSS